VMVESASCSWTWTLPIAPSTSSADCVPSNWTFAGNVESGIDVASNRW
jgi:hypothetical protein